MRKVISTVVVLALAWCGWWYVAATGFERSVENWLEQRRAQGWQAEVSGIVRGGFPLELRADLMAPALADPSTGLAFETRVVRLSAPTHWPGDVTLTFPGDALMFASPQGKTEILADAAQAILRLHPGTMLELEQMALTSGAWKMTDTIGDLAAASALTADMSQDPSDPNTYHFVLGAPQFRLGDVPRDALFIPEDWPVEFDRMAVDMTIGFDRPWDRRAIEENRPQPRAIALKLAEAAWGELRLKLAGKLDIDDAGAATGVMSVQADNWRDILTLAESAGFLPPGLRPQADSALTMLAGLSGNPNSLDVQINFSDGWMSVGFIPIGPAPRFILR
ncbi:MAG: DUF2125 domain-containing protein [Sulfitobacter sp.]